MTPRVFALHDKHPGPPQELRNIGAHVRRLNNEGYGIFQVVNQFTGRRLVENMTRIDWWYADLDTGTKAEQLERILLQPIKPSRVVETKKGHHVYYKATDATLGNWDRIVKRGLVPALEGDPRATDPLRLLRVPGFYHHKAEPFLVRTIAEADVAYTESQMMGAFPEVVKEHSLVTIRDRLQAEQAGFWHRVAGLSAREVVKRLSGHELVNGEEMRLIDTGGGKANIQVRAKGKTWRGTPCWITQDDTLAGVEGGSSAGAWCKWYGKSWAEIAMGLKELFPEELGDEGT
jgi:hypothetical protein